MKKTQDCLVNQITYQYLENQIQIIKKVITKIGGHSWSKKIPKELLYQISTYIFVNPLRLKQGLFVQSPQWTLRQNITYLLIKKNQNHCLTWNTEQNKRFSGYLTLGSQWKSVKIAENLNYNEILQKGSFFLTFLSNLKLYPLNWTEEDEPENVVNQYQREKKQKQQNKFHHLISESFEQHHSYFTEIFRYKKDKKINELLIKAFASLMTKNILCLKIEKNYNTEPLDCEGKYLVVESARKLSLSFRRNRENIIKAPRIQYAQNNSWSLCEGQHQQNSFFLYKQAIYPIKRGTHLLLTRSLNQIVQDDVWIQNIQEYSPSINNEINDQNEFY